MSDLQLGGRKYSKYPLPRMHQTPHSLWNLGLSIFLPAFKVLTVQGRQDIPHLVQAPGLASSRLLSQMTYSFGGRGITPSLSGWDLAHCSIQPWSAQLATSGPIPGARCQGQSPSLPWFPPAQKAESKSVFISQNSLALVLISYNSY